MCSAYLGCRPSCRAVASRNVVFSGHSLWETGFHLFGSSFQSQRQRAEGRGPAWQAALHVWLSRGRSYVAKQSALLQLQKGPMGRAAQRPSVPAGSLGRTAAGCVVLLAVQCRVVGRGGSGPPLPRTGWMGRWASVAVTGPPDSCLLIDSLWCASIYLPFPFVGFFLFPIDPFNFLLLLCFFQLITSWDLHFLLNIF